MKNYSRTKGNAKRTTYRTPSRFIAQSSIRRPQNNGVRFGKSGISSGDCER